MFQLVIKSETQESADISEIERRQVRRKALSVFNAIDKMASRELNGSAKTEYRNGLSLDHEQNQSVITLSGEKAIRIEKGFASFDMKVGFAKSAKKKSKKKGGWYLTIPMKEETSGVQALLSYLEKALISVGLKKRASLSRIPFRTVSDLTDQNSWIHPGIQGIKLFQRSMTEND